MKKIALVFVLAVFVPSLVLAWLAVRSLRDQQLILERQQSLLFQGVADALAKDADGFLTEQQHEFGHEVENLIAGPNAQNLNVTFDDRLRTNWRYAEVGFVVRLDNGLMSCPSPAASPACAVFVNDFGKFLGNREIAQVYVNNSKTGNNFDNGGQSVNQSSVNQAANNFSEENSVRINQQSKGQPVAQVRNVSPALNSGVNGIAQNPNEPQFSKLAWSEAEFRQLVGDAGEGTVARFVENKLKVLLWHRSSHDTNLVFGAQLSLARLKEGLQAIPDQLDPALREDVAVAVLDDLAKPVAVSPAGFQANWKHPFVATEIGEALPHWELAVYLLDPAKLARSAHSLELTLGLLIGVLILAIGIGGWLIFADLNRQLTLARQKTDFVSNVSHELKTPLTSIRMFSELLAEGRVAEPSKRQTYLNIITAETSRLTRLINNVLDFSRMDRGEKKYNFQPCDLVELARETVETYRPHLESNGFTIQYEHPPHPALSPNAPRQSAMQAGEGERVRRTVEGESGGPGYGREYGDAPEITVNGDRDAIAQVLVNLLSNAEKYSNGAKEITVQIEQLREPLPYAEVRVLDRGAGVPRGSEEKIFEQFYRAHDSLGSGIQGSGLGLTLARQIARAHGGDVVYRPREGGGSCFILRLPIQSSGSKTTA